MGRLFKRHAIPYLHRIIRRIISRHLTVGMRSIFSILFLSTVLLGTTACQSDKKRSPIKYGDRDNRDDGYSDRSGGWESAPSGAEFGDVVGESGYESYFEETVIRFLTATTNPKDIGRISGYPDDDTGVRFWGQVDTGGLDPSDDNNIELGGRGELRILVFDSYAGTRSDEGEDIEPFQMYFRNLEDGYIDGNYAVLHFADKYGAITLEGEFDEEIFTGTMSFENFRHYDDRTPESDVLGVFRVPTCGFFVCD